MKKSAAEMKKEIEYFNLNLKQSKRNISRALKRIQRLKYLYGDIRTREAMMFIERAICNLHCSKRAMRSSRIESMIFYFHDYLMKLELDEIPYDDNFVNMKECVRIWHEKVWQQAGPGETEL